MRKNAPPCPLGYGGDVLCSSGPDQCALADPGHGLHPSVALAAFQKLNCMMQLTALHQHRMILNGLFNSLWFNADVTLCGGGAAVLQQSLN